MKQILFSHIFLLAVTSTPAHAEDYNLVETVRVELPGLVQLIGKKTKCRVIAELKTSPTSRNKLLGYQLLAKHEVCSDGIMREVHLQGSLKPSLEGRVMAGTLIDLTPIK